MSSVSIAELFSLPTPESLDFKDPILVIDGDEDARLLLVHHLQKLQHKNIVQMPTAYDALCYMRENKPTFSVTICCMETPIMSGVDYLSEISNAETFERGPFIMAIENPNKEKIMFAMENGVDEVVIKPYKLDDITPKIRSAFKINHNRKNPEKVYELAKRKLRSGDVDGAEKVYKAIVEHTEKSARPLVGLAKVEFLRKNYRHSLDLLEAAIGRNPNFVHAFAEKGDIYACTGDISQAIIAYQQAIALSPLNPERYEAVARLFWDLNKYEQIVSFMRLAKSNGLDFPALAKYMSRSLFMLRQFREAIPYFKEAISFDSNNLELLNQLGVSYKETKSYEEASKVYNSIIKMDPDNIDALFNKAVLLHAQKKTREAIKMLERVTKKNPDHIGARALLSEFRTESGAA